MEGLTRLVSESLARHGFDRPLDYSRLHWSRWFRCESHHSLLFVPSKPGVFAVAEEIMDLDKGADTAARRMLAVTQFFEDDDMAFVLDRMLSRENPMRARLTSGRYFVRFVVIEDHAQRRGICSALNQWMVSSTEKVTGIGSHFATSLELTPATEYVPQSSEGQGNLFEEATDAGSQDAHVETGTSQACPEPGRRVPRTLSEAQGTSSGAKPGSSASASSPTVPLDSGAATNIHCPSPFPSGF